MNLPGIMLILIRTGTPKVPETMISGTLGFLEYVLRINIFSCPFIIFFFGYQPANHSSRSIQAHEPIGTAIVCTISALSHTPVHAVGIHRIAPVQRR